MSLWSEVWDAPREMLRWVIDFLDHLAMGHTCCYGVAFVMTRSASEGFVKAVYRSETWSFEF